MRKNKTDAKSIEQSFFELYKLAYKETKPITDILKDVVDALPGSDEEPAPPTTPAIPTNYEVDLLPVNQVGGWGDVSQTLSLNVELPADITSAFTEDTANEVVSFINDLDRLGVDSPEKMNQFTQLAQLLLSYGRTLDLIPEEITQAASSSRDELEKFSTIYTLLPKSKKISIVKNAFLSKLISMDTLKKYLPDELSAEIEAIGGSNAMAWTKEIILNAHKIYNGVKAVQNILQGLSSYQVLVRDSKQIGLEWYQTLSPFALRGAVDTYQDNPQRLALIGRISKTAAKFISECLMVVLRVLAAVPKEQMEKALDLIGTSNLRQYISKFIEFLPFILIFMDFVKSNFLTEGTTVVYDYLVNNKIKEILDNRLRMGL